MLPWQETEIKVCILFQLTFVLFQVTFFFYGFQFSFDFSNYNNPGNK